MNLYMRTKSARLDEDVQINPLSTWVKLDDLRSIAKTFEVQMLVVQLDFSWEVK